jgi:hypothetical protein
MSLMKMIQSTHKIIPPSICSELEMEGLSVRYDLIYLGSELCVLQCWVESLPTSCLFLAVYSNIGNNIKMLLLLFFSLSLSLPFFQWGEEGSLNYKRISAHQIINMKIYVCTCTPIWKRLRNRFKMYCNSFHFVETYWTN